MPARSLCIAVYALPWGAIDQSCAIIMDQDDELEFCKSLSCPLNSMACGFIELYEKFGNDIAVGPALKRLGIKPC